MRLSLAALAVVSMLNQLAGQDSTRVLKLALPHALRAGEGAWLEVTLGAVPRGTEVDVETASGESLGVVSPFAVRSGVAAGTYVIPVPANAISKGAVSVRLVVRGAGHAAHAPSPREVTKVRVTIGPDVK
jgi:hypothetical protein